MRFSYDGNREVIDGVSFTIRKGETVALVGPSGGGKSTLSELIPRFYDIQGGDILIDGTSIRNYTQESLRAHMSVVAQDTILFNDTNEATSALDTESEKLVQDALNSLLKGRTSIVIAHRLSTVHNADKIIVIDHGRIAEQGTHEELMARGGIYSKLIEMQSVA